MIAMRCKMQDNGFTQFYGRALSIQEMRNLCGCEVPCNQCPCLVISGGGNDERKALSQTRSSGE